MPQLGHAAFPPHAGPNARSPRRVGVPIIRRRRFVHSRLTLSSRSRTRADQRRVRKSWVWVGWWWSRRLRRVEPASRVPRNGSRGGQGSDGAPANPRRGPDRSDTDGASQVRTRSRTGATQKRAGGLLPVPARGSDPHRAVRAEHERSADQRGGADPRPHGTQVAGVAIAAGSG